MTHRFDNDELTRATSPEGKAAQLEVAKKLVGRGLFDEVFVELPNGDVAHVHVRPNTPASKSQRPQRGQH